jgi:hypothetical protein
MRVVSLAPFSIETSDGEYLYAWHILPKELYRKHELPLVAEPESGLMLDALAVADWAMNVASIPSSRILIFAQSMGTAVSIAVSKNLALQPPPVVFAGTILVAPFVDVVTLVATYRSSRCCSTTFNALYRING